MDVILVNGDNVAHKIAPSHSSSKSKVKKRWKDIKDQVCSGESYKQEAWFTVLKDHEKTLLSDLKQIQLKLGTDKSIEP